MFKTDFSHFTGIFNDPDGEVIDCRVPILNFTSKDRMEVDININETTAIRNTSILNAYSNGKFHSTVVWAVSQRT
jgi:hypothetical protein